MAATYNGITFTYPLTTGHTYGPVKDPSGSDQLYTEYHLTIESLITVGLLPWHAGELTPAQTLARVRHYLTQPRGSFYYDLTSLPGQTGADPVINLPSGRDDATGPWPDDSALVIHYTTPGTLFVRWSCTLRLRDCGNPDMVSTPLSHRWVDAVSWDASSKCTYTRNGTLILSSKSAESLDWWRRNKLAPKITPGFRRVSTDFTMSSDQLRCDYTTVDEQIRFAPPGTAVRMSITQSESAPIGPIRKGAVAVTLVGLQNSSVVDMARWALIIMAARVKAARALQVAAGGTVALMGVVNLETREHDDSVEVTAACTYKVDPNKGRVVALVGAAGGAFAAAVGKVQTINLSGQNTPQGRQTQGLPIFPWVGNGTSAATAQNPGGFAGWANPTGMVGGPVDGVGTATAVSLYAAMLSDPCSATLEAQPDAAPFETELRTQPSQYNTEQKGGMGGTPPTSESQSQLTASISNLNAAQYPATVPVALADSLWNPTLEAGVYDLWQCSNEYADDPGRMVAPTCTTGGVNKRIDYGSESLTLVRRWYAKRVGAPPRLPPRIVNKPASGEADPNWIYVGGDPAPAVRELGIAADGVDVIFEAEGVYIFQALDTSLTTLAAEIPPFMDPLVGSQLAAWPEGATLVADGFGPPAGAEGSSLTAGFSFGVSVGTPLGSGTLGIVVNP